MRIAILVAVPLLASGSAQAAVPRPTWNGTRLTPLKFNKDGTFQISIFSDLHFGESKRGTPRPLNLDHYVDC